MDPKEVVININSIHDVRSGGGDRLNFMTDGIYSFDGKSGFIRYYESEVTGMPGTRTDMIINPDGIIVDRKGSVTSRMEFKEGLKTSFLYNTPYGTATLGMNTGTIRKTVDENGCKVDIDYVISFEHAITIENRFTLEVTGQ